MEDSDAISAGLARMMKGGYPSETKSKSSATKQWYSPSAMPTVDAFCAQHRKDCIHVIGESNAVIFIPVISEFIDQIEGPFELEGQQKLDGEEEYEPHTKANVKLPFSRESESEGGTTKTTPAVCDLLELVHQLDCNTHPDLFEAARKVVNAAGEEENLIFTRLNATLEVPRGEKPPPVLFATAHLAASLAQYAGLKAGPFGGRIMVTHQEPAWTSNTSKELSKSEILARVFTNGADDAAPSRGGGVLRQEVKIKMPDSQNKEKKMIQLISSTHCQTTLNGQIGSRLLIAATVGDDGLPCEVELFVYLVLNFQGKDTEYLLIPLPPLVTENDGEELTWRRIFDLGCKALFDDWTLPLPKAFDYLKHQWDLVNRDRLDGAVNQVNVDIYESYLLQTHCILTPDNVRSESLLKAFPDDAGHSMFIKVYDTSGSPKSSRRLPPLSLVDRINPNSNPRVYKGKHRSYYVRRLAEGSVTGFPEGFSISNLFRPFLRLHSGHTESEVQKLENDAHAALDNMQDLKTLVGHFQQILKDLRLKQKHLRYTHGDVRIANMVFARDGTVIPIDPDMHAVEDEHQKYSIHFNKSIENERHPNARQTLTIRPEHDVHSEIDIAEMALHGEGGMIDHIRELKDMLASIPMTRPSAESFDFAVAVELVASSLFRSHVAKRPSSTAV